MGCYFLELSTKTSITYRHKCACLFDVTLVLIDMAHPF